MRMMLKAHVDNSAGSRAVADGSLPVVMKKMLETLKPEAAYFGPDHGMRTAFIVFDMADPSELPAMTEPLYSQLGAHVEIFPVMNQEDLQRGLSRLQQA
jgi:uncharacterized protein DUF3303